MRIHVYVDGSPNDFLTVPLARQLAGCFRALADRCDAYTTERPRSRTTSGLVVAHGGHLIFFDLTPPPVASRVKIITPPVNATGDK